MNRFARRPVFETYSPGRKDARINEAVVMLKMRRTLDGLTVSGLSACFHLRPETAERLIDEERGRRGLAS